MNTTKENNKRKLRYHKHSNSIKSIVKGFIINSAKEEISQHNINLEQSKYISFLGTINSRPLSDFY